MTPFILRPVAVCLLGLSLVLILGGVSILFAAGPVSLPFQPPNDDASIAYSSGLVITVDDRRTPSDLLAAWGGVLFLAGLIVSAAAAGLRLGQESTSHE
ncbi:hypothetical protein [Arthrobacter sp. H20]|uniref:hypothetical protein n=1 Tax=Arthrobacter sp. H20 TaxID=1267981 RepID=UPI00047C9A57|nr:hypothetical protein [Arthrobacter sp. H20]